MTLATLADVRALIERRLPSTSETIGFGTTSRQRCGKPRKVGSPPQKSTQRW
jgi:hypothetical protein